MAKNKRPVSERRYIHVIRTGVIDCDEHPDMTPEQMISSGCCDMCEETFAHKDAPYPVLLAVQDRVGDAMRQLRAKLLLDGIALYEARGGDVPDSLAQRIAAKAGEEPPKRPKRND